MPSTAEPPLEVDASIEKETTENAKVASQKELPVKCSDKAEIDAAGDDETTVEKESTEDASENNDISKLERAINRQVNYYFGDANLNRDKFLLEQISKDKEGWVPFSVLLTFKRLSELTTDASVIVKALSKDDEGLIQISDDGEKLRRHPDCPVPEQNEERRKDIQSRTAYAKGFPLDTNISDLIEFFAPYEKVVNISMRKYLDKPTKSYKFKGSVFVTFEKKEQMHEFVEKDKVLYQERELIRKHQVKYNEQKREDLKAKKDSKASAKAIEEEKLFFLPKGTVVFFENVPETVTRELLRAAVKEIEGAWDIAYVDFNKGDPKGYIRFHEEDIAAKFLEKLEDNKLKLNDEIVLTLRTLTDEEEKAFLANAIEQMKNQRNTSNRRKGHHHNNRKRQGSNDNRNEEKRKKKDN